MDNSTKPENLVHRIGKFCDIGCTTICIWQHIDLACRYDNLYVYNTYIDRMHKIIYRFGSKQIPSQIWESTHRYLRELKIYGPRREYNLQKENLRTARMPCLVHDDAVESAELAPAVERPVAALHQTVDHLTDVVQCVVVAGGYVLQHITTSSNIAHIRESLACDETRRTLP